MHITFQYFGIVEGKRIKLYLSLTGFQCSDFFLSFFTVEWPFRSWLTSLAFSKLCSTLFMGDFPLSRLNSACLSNVDFCPKLKILLQISLTGNGILARRVCGPIIRLFLLPPPSQVTPTWFTKTPSFQQTTCHRVRVTWPSFPYHFNGQS